MSRNGERAERARAALDALQTDGEDAIVDLVADLLHYARRRTLDPKRVAERAVATWMAEDRDPTGDGKRHLGLGIIAHLRAHTVLYAMAAVALALVADEITELLHRFISL